jgi:hypothetical protein
MQRCARPDLDRENRQFVINGRQMAVKFKTINADLDDRVPASALLMTAEGGVTLGDLGYCGKKFQDLLISEKLIQISSNLR